MHIASRMEGITEVEGLINELCEEFHVDETHYGEILIAMTEAVNNAIVHSWAFSGCSLKISGFSVLYMARK